MKTGLHDRVYREVCRKPPIGIEPRWSHEERRIEELKEAIDRYMDSDYLVPSEWVEEYNELMRRKNMRTA